MTYEEILQRANINRRRSPRDEEHRLQCSCVSWFNSRYPKLKGLLYAVPNGGRRDKVTASKLKQEGVVAGVCDRVYTPRLKDWIDIPKSISFASMDEAEFREVYYKVREVLFEYYLQQYLSVTEFN